MADTNEDFVDITENKDGGLLKKILVEGTGEESPPVGSHVTVHYVGTLHSDGSKFDSSRDRPGHFKFDVGVGQVIKGWDQGICTMKKGEKCILRCSSDYAYGDRGSPPDIPGGATLNFEVELFDWKEKVKTAGQMTAEERVAHATKMKELGTEAFKVGDFATAVNRYADGAEYITFDPSTAMRSLADGQDQGDDEDSEDDEMGDDSGTGSAGPVALSEDDKKLALALLNNCAICRLKLGEADSAKFDCNKVLQYDDKNSKAMYRRAECEFAMGNWKACNEDATRALELEPGNKAAEQLKKKADYEEKAAKKKEKAMYSKMFG